MTGIPRHGGGWTLASLLALLASLAHAQTPTQTTEQPAATTTEKPAVTTTEKPAATTTEKPAIESEVHPGHFFVPGHYEPTDGRTVRPLDPPDAKGLTWRAAYWAREQPGWIWQPSGWQKSDAGWSFRAGKWIRVPSQPPTPASSSARPTNALRNANLERLRMANALMLSLPQNNPAINTNTNTPSAPASGNQITGHSYFNYSPGSFYPSYVNSPGSTQSYFNYSPGSNYPSYASTPGAVPTQSYANYSPGSVYPSYVPTGATGSYGTPPPGNLGGPPGGNP